MAGGSIQRIAVVGGGPTGAALATWLVRAGRRVALFTRAKRPPIVIGESLVPAVIPFLRDLGVEETIARFSTFKPGATFVFHPGRAMRFRFQDARGVRTPYAWNVPRDRFDRAILDAAVVAGAVPLDLSATLAREEGERVRLTGEAQDAARRALGGEPDWIVDAGGRARQVARLLDLPTRAGPRRDVALHAHCTGVEVLDPGNVHTDRLERGWSWRIPLPGCVSVGLVVPGGCLARLGGSAEEQFDAFLQQDDATRQWAGDARRISPVVRYSNYQLRATRGVGPNWALLGDAFGFVDPVLSSGLLIGLDGARSLAGALTSGRPRDLDRYQARVVRNLDDWTHIVDAYYSGRLFTLFQVGESVRQTRIGGAIDFHFRKHIPRVFTGEASDSRYSIHAVRWMLRHGLAGNDPAEFAVR